MFNISRIYKNYCSTISYTSVSFGYIFESFSAGKSFNVLSFLDCGLVKELNRNFGLVKFLLHISSQNFLLNCPYISKCLLRFSVTNLKISQLKI